MQKIVYFLICFSLCTCVEHSQGASTKKNNSRKTLPPQALKLKKAIDSILLPKRFRHLQAGIVVYSLDKKQVIYERNPNLMLIPASVNKLFTAYVALKKLKPSHKFRTHVYIDGPVKDGKLTGNIFLKGEGDPILVSERMWMLVNDVNRWGIKEITGNVVGDASYFDTERTPVSRPDYLRDQAYNSPVGALSFNFNTTAIYVKPGEKKGAPLVFHTDPPENTYIDVVNQAKTGGVRAKASLNVSRIEPAKSEKWKNIPSELRSAKAEVGDTVLLRGSLPIGHRELRYYRNIVNPTLYTCHMFKLFLERSGVTVRGNVLANKVPKTAKKIVSFESLPLWHIIWGMNKFSNNFTADQILKRVGAEMWGTPGTLQKGITALEDSLEDIGIARNTYKIADGSGLTRKSRVSAKQIVTLLAAAYRDFTINPEFIASLGIAGTDGTLRRRLSNTIASERLRGKTGTLDGASSLAGYVPSKDGELLAFAIVLNDPKSRYGRMTGWVNKVAVEIAKFSRKK